LSVNGKTVQENYGDAQIQDARVIRPYGTPLKERAGFLVVSQVISFSPPW